MKSTYAHAQSDLNNISVRQNMYFLQSLQTFALIEILWGSH